MKKLNSDFVYLEDMYNDNRGESLLTNFHDEKLMDAFKNLKILNCNKKLHTFKKSSCINLIKLILE